MIKNNNFFLNQLPRIIIVYKNYHHEHAFTNTSTYLHLTVQKTEKHIY